MAEKPKSGDILGIPYNFERPNLGRLVAAHWQPDEGMLVRKPFGIGYTLNLANWRSWIVLAVAAALYYQQGSTETEPSDLGDDDGPVEVVVDDD